MREGLPMRAQHLLGHVKLFAARVRVQVREVLSRNGLVR